MRRTLRTAIGPAWLLLWLGLDDHPDLGHCPVPRDHLGLADRLALLVWVLDQPDLGHLLLVLRNRLGLLTGLALAAS